MAMLNNQMVTILEYFEEHCLMGISSIVSFGEIMGN